MNRQRVVVVGGGVIGVSCAHFLRQADFNVTLIERERVGSGCSHANCGYVSPSHALPLAGPGMVLEGLKTLFRREAPLAIRWRFDPHLWAWLWRFARRCHPRAMWESAKAINALLSSSRQLYEQLFSTTDIQAEWTPCGLIFVFRSANGMAHYAEVDHALREHFHLGAERLDGPNLTTLEPALVDGLAGGWLYRNDAQLRPDLLMAGWRQLISSSGVELLEQRTFRGFVKRGSKVTAVKTDQGDVATDAVVMATGAWTPLLHKALGVRVPIQPGKGYSITMPRPTRCPKFPMIFEEHRTAITPFADRYRIGSTMEFAGYDARLKRRRLDMLKRSASYYLHTPTAEPPIEEWWGWRPMVFDGRPIIGFVPKFDNVVIAAGHGMLGLSMATGTGKLVTELLSNQQTHLDAAAYRVDRF